MAPMAPMMWRPMPVPYIPYGQMVSAMGAVPAMAPGMPAGMTAYMPAPGMAPTAVSPAGRYSGSSAAGGGTAPPGSSAAGGAAAVPVGRGGGAPPSAYERPAAAAAAAAAGHSARDFGSNNSAAPPPRYGSGSSAGPSGDGRYQSEQQRGTGAYVVSDGSRFAGHAERSSSDASAGLPAGAEGGVPRYGGRGGSASPAAAANMAAAAGGYDRSSAPGHRGERYNRSSTGNRDSSHQGHYGGQDVPSQQQQFSGQHGSQQLSRQGSGAAAGPQQYVAPQRYGPQGSSGGPPVPAGTPGQ
eukprot:gene14098-14224_t